MTNLQNTGFTVGSNQFDIANIVTAWSSEVVNGNRVLSTTSGGYVFPQVGYGFSDTINGQIVSIFNQTGNSFRVYTIGVQVFFNGTYYNSNQNFTINNNSIASFVLIQGNYYVQLAYNSFN